YPDDPISLVGKPKPKAEPREEKPSKTAAAPVAAAAATAVAAAKPKAPPMRPVVKPSAPPYQPSEESKIGQLMIAGIAGGIALMFLAGYMARSKPLNSGIGNAGPIFSAQCPPGQVPSSILDVLEPSGPIIDDTE
ncbi:MAG: hypothetical protein AAFY81_11160, partial [Pseudomonadota bacterium]